MKMEIKIKEGIKKYPIHISSFDENEIANKIYKKYQGKKVLLVSDENVMDLYGHKITAALEKRYELYKLIITPGEESKNYLNLRCGHDILAENDFGRDSLVAAFGGGVVGDLAGFIAASYMRGISYVQIPTTLLAQVDSSVGGKTAVNHPQGKNLVGAFKQPLMVLINPTYLKTLPQREIRTGLAEIIKHAFIADREFVDFLYDNNKKIKNIDMDIYKKIIHRSCSIKAEVVEKDEKESGIRAILNFGHTIGHALEAVTAYQKYNHGEAVAIGMLGAGRISNRMGYFKESELQKLESLIEIFNLPLKFEYNENVGEVYNKLFSDKKARDNKLCWILIKEFGQAFIEKNVNDNIIINVLEELK